MNETTILCVDDDTTVLRSLRSLLGNLGSRYAIEIAESADEALEIEADLRSQGRHLSVIIADFIMPGMRGDELLIRVHQSSPQVVKIMLTGQSDFEGVKEAINKANLYRFLEKPYNNDDLLLTIKSACLAFESERDMVLQNEQLRRLSAELESMLGTVRRQHEDLTRSEAKATISTLVASVSHELGTPLGNGLLTAETMRDIAQKFQVSIDAGQISRSTLAQFVEAVHEGSAMMQRNLQRASDLLANFKQVSADQASEQHRTFDLYSVVHDVVESMKPSLRSQPHRIVLDLATGIHMDSLPGALGQVLINVINNAYLHAFEGRDNGILTIAASEQGDEVHLRVSDNGVGMSPAVLARVREPFFSTKIGKGGTGLGMAIVANLLEKSLGGTLQIQSTQGVGTVINITLARTVTPAH